ncbi:MAG: 50S ribosomal protein L18 [Candidatus Portnoybacteria bacterium]|nr:50S ribosomal protein L18 [Candidatus Portnoybacteria bacterium]
MQSAKFKIISGRRERRARRTRAKIRGTSTKPRLSVFRSNRYMWVEAIDDEKGITVAAASGTLKDSGKIGTAIAKVMKAKKMSAVVFDRGRFAYHGHVEKLAQEARKAGLEF